MMRSRPCPICSARMLVYHNPPRLKCPREAKHYLYLNGKRLGTKGYKGPGKKKKR